VSRAIIAVSGQRPEAAKDLLGVLLSTIRKINSPNDLAQSLADFFGSGSIATATFVATASNIFHQAVDAAADLPSDALRTHALIEAMRMYAALGDFISAQAVLERLPFPDNEGRTLAERLLSNAKERSAVTGLSAFERVFLGTGNIFNGNGAVLHSIRISGETQDVLAELSAYLASGGPASREDLLNWVRTMLVPARALGGTAAVASIVRRVRDFDRRLLEAGRLIAEAEAQQRDGAS